MRPRVAARDFFFALVFRLVTTRQTFAMSLVAQNDFRASIADNFLQADTLRALLVYAA